MSCVFPRRFKKNPYADRGLAQFSRLSAELKARRKQLLDQLGTPFCYVLFASESSDQTKWVPIIIRSSPSCHKARALKRPAMESTTKDIVVHRSSGREFMQAGSSCGNTGRSSDAASMKCSDDADLRFPLEPAIPQSFAAAEKLLWMAAYVLSVAMDIARSLLGIKASPPASQRWIPTLQSQEATKFAKPNTSAARRVPEHAPSASQPRNTAETVMPAVGHRRTKQPAHWKNADRAPDMHKKWRQEGIFTAPSSPRGTRQLKKPLQACISLPKASAAQSPAMAKKTPHRNIQSPPSVEARVQKCDPQSSSKQDRENIENSETWSQNLAGAGVVLALSGLVMGFVPAIVSIICWWYLLPSLRKPIRDSPTLGKARHMEH